MTEPDDHDGPPPGQPYGGPPPGWSPPGGPPPGGASPGWSPTGGPPPGGPPPPYGPGYGYGPYAPPYGQQGVTSADDTTWALAAYLGQLAVGFVAPLVVYLARRDESPFTRFHGAQALNAALTYIIAFFAAFTVGMVSLAFRTPVGLIIMIPLILILAIAHFVYLIIGAVKAGRREMYRLPAWICWRMFK
jgi:uncharacterized protein